MTSFYLELVFCLEVPKATKEKYTFNAKILYKRILFITTVRKCLFLLENIYFSEKHHFHILVILACSGD